MRIFSDIVFSGVVAGVPFFFCLDAFVGPFDVLDAGGAGGLKDVRVPPHHLRAQPVPHLGDGAGAHVISGGWARRGGCRVGLVEQRGVEKDLICHITQLAYEFQTGR